MKCKNCGSKFDIQEATIGEMRERHCPACGKLIRWGLNPKMIMAGAVGLVTLVNFAKLSLPAVLISAVIVLAFSLELKKT